MQKVMILESVVFSLLLVLKGTFADYLLPPPKWDGFVYNHNNTFDRNSILIEAFYDPMCSDSSDSWPPLKQALQFYGPRVSLVAHLLPLPYHDNAFLTSRALHIVNGLNTSATFPLLEWFFSNQLRFGGEPTKNLSKVSIIEKIVESATGVIGSSYRDSIKNGFDDPITEVLTRVSFKYSASRGVYGTPSFYVNGFVLPNTGSAIDYDTWRKIIDPLVGSKKSAKI